jgi:hypothetical protein
VVTDEMSLIYMMDTLMGRENTIDPNHGLLKERCVLVIIKSLQSNKVFCSVVSEPKMDTSYVFFSDPAEITKTYGIHAVRVFIPIDQDSQWPLPETFLPHTSWSQLVIIMTRWWIE